MVVIEALTNVVETPLGLRINDDDVVGCCDLIDSDVEQVLLIIRNIIDYGRATMDVHVNFALSHGTVNAPEWIVNLTKVLETTILENCRV